LSTIFLEDVLVCTTILKQISHTTSTAFWKQPVALSKQSLAGMVSEVKNPREVRAFPKHQSASALLESILSASSSLDSASVRKKNRSAYT
jgi:hypothetical protein